MKCPRCGSEMNLDDHRKIPLQMCYNCGYIEGRTVEKAKGKTNYEHMKTLSFTELAAFLAESLDLNEKTVTEWLEREN